MTSGKVAATCAATAAAAAPRACGLAEQTGDGGLFVLAAQAVCRIWPTTGETYPAWVTLAAAAASFLFTDFLYIFPTYCIYIIFSA